MPDVKDHGEFGDSIAYSCSNSNAFLADLGWEHELQFIIQICSVV